LARFAIASPPLVAYTLYTRKRGMQTGFNWRTNSLLFLALGLTGVTFLYVLQFYSLKFVTATTGSILINLNVIFATILSGILKERMAAKKLIGVSLAFMGVIVLATNGGSPTDSAPGQSTGALLMVGAAVCWALYSILTKKVLHLFSASTITSVTFVIGTICLLPFAIVEMSTAPITSLSWSTWLSILYLAIPS
jgi:drug/metabolite transporter (DMT)-like permease